MSCLIDKDFIQDCGDINPSGVGDKLMIYNKEDWDSMKANGTVIFDGTDGSISSIANETAKRAFEFDVPPGAFKPTSAPVVIEGNYTMFEHSANFPIIVTDQDAKNTAQALANGKVVIVYMKYTGKGEVVGNEQGLNLQAGTYEPGNSDTGGTLPLEMKSARKETKMPLTYFNTDEATTLAEFNNLNVAGV
ncbi:MAG: hypothetical protein DRI95_00570 [Bacteroidetes bacterium]|nr:MAG: hypothetical protein DRI95_00570 [Bacteroidota bacterium]